MSESVSAGDPALVVVSTPIGNLGDLSPRAVSELKAASRIACEDTRRTGRLLKHFGISHEPLLRCDEHSEAAAAAEIVRRIEAGERIALVSDAGTPGISDPGHRVVREVVAAGHTVTGVPGPNAAMAALAISGFRTDRFCFEGFLPRKGSTRHRRIEQMAGESRTLVVYESPRRVGRTLAELSDSLGPERGVAVARELTKLHEEVWRGSLGEAATHYSVGEPRGEFVIVIAGAEAEPLPESRIRAALVAERDSGATRRQAVDAVVSGLAAPKSRVYELALDLEFD